MISIYKRNIPNSETFLGISSGIAGEVEITGDGVKKSKRSGDARMSHPSQNHQYEEHRHHLQRVLMPSLQSKNFNSIRFVSNKSFRKKKKKAKKEKWNLNTVEELCIFVLGFKGVKGGVINLILLASHPYLDTHPYAEKAVSHHHQRYVPVFFS